MDLLGRSTASRNGQYALIIAALLALSSTTHYAAARTLGVQANDSFTFSYEVFTTYATPNGNQSSTQANQLSLSVLWTNTAATLGEVAYSELITEVNGTTVSAPSAVQNTTTVLDPYNNDTYLGNIGFYPFTYTDLNAGSADDLPISLTVGNTPSGDLTGAQSVNATVARGPGTISVNFSIFSSGSVPPAQTVLVYNATTGVLVHGTTYTHFFDVEKNFIYTLIASSTPPAGIFNADVQVLLVASAIVVVAVVVVWRVTSSTGKRKYAKAREKMRR